MEIIKWFLIASLFLTACADDKSQFRQSVLSGYEGRCKQVLATKDYLDSEIRSECSCEVAVINADFSTFELIAIDAKKATGVDPIPEESIAELRRKLQTCKARSPENAAS